MRWTKKELEMLASRYHSDGVTVLAAKMGRSVRSVADAARYHGISGQKFLGKALCVACRERIACRPRCLCWPCYKQLDVRDLHPSTSRFACKSSKGQEIEFDGSKLDPPEWSPPSGLSESLLSRLRQLAECCRNGPCCEWQLRQMGWLPVALDYLLGEAARYGAWFVRDGGQVSLTNAGRTALRVADDAHGPVLPTTPGARRGRSGSMKRKA